MDSATAEPARISSTDLPIVERLAVLDLKVDTNAKADERRGDRNEAGLTALQVEVRDGFEKMTAALTVQSGVLERMCVTQEGHAKWLMEIWGLFKSVAVKAAAGVAGAGGLIGTLYAIFGR